MTLSMTGFGSSSCQDKDTTIAVEVRAVNHRFLDLHVRLGREYGFLEGDVQQVVRGMIARGRVDVNVLIRMSTPTEMLIDSKVARGYLEASQRLRGELNLADHLDLRTILSLPGVIQDRETVLSGNRAPSELAEALKKCLREALESVVQMREREGKALKNEMLGYLGAIREKNDQIRTILPSTVNEYRSRLEERLALLVPPRSLDPQRVAQEIAILVERSDISEEVARMGSHLDQYHQVIEAGKEVGKKLDFLLQEMQREVNTMLSKTGNLEITRLGIAIKADIEKLREQVQNVE
jgi:uncharacterized protein (TIGR00255 family)